MESVTSDKDSYYLIMKGSNQEEHRTIKSPALADSFFTTDLPGKPSNTSLPQEIRKISNNIYIQDIWKKEQTKFKISRRK